MQSAKFFNRLNKLNYNVIYITSLRSRSWWKNLRGGAHVSVCLKGQDIKTYGDEIEDYENVTKQLMVYLQNISQYARYFMISLDSNDNPNPEDVAQAAKERVMILLRSR